MKNNLKLFLAVMSISIFAKADDSGIRVRPGTQFFEYGNQITVNCGFCIFPQGKGARIIRQQAERFVISECAKMGGHVDIDSVNTEETQVVSVFDNGVSIASTAIVQFSCTRSF